MTTDIVFYPHAIRTTAISGGAEGLILTLLEDVQPSNNFQDLTSWCAAQVGPQQVGSHMASPDNRFSTPQVATLLTALASGPYGICQDYSASYVDTWYRAGANLGMRVANATSAHLRMRAQANTLLALESLEASEGGLAMARCRLCHILNPQTGADPLVPTADQALAGTASGGRLHTLGPITLNGTELKGCTQARLDLNVEYDQESSHGDGFLTWCSIYRIRPVITLRTRMSEYMATFGSRGTAFSSLTWYLRSKLAGGINEADASAYHVKIVSSAAGAIKAHSLSGSKAECLVTIELAQSAEDTAPFTISVNQAIS